MAYVGDKATYYVYNKDIHGSITNLIDGNGESVKGYSYDDFGTSISFGDSSVKNELTYTGAVYDELTGLYYMNARYYDSGTGRFLSQDSVRGNAKDENTWILYTYCANDPINYVDPSGQISVTVNDVKDGLGAAAAEGAAFGPAGVVVAGIFLFGCIIYSYNNSRTYSNASPQPTAKKEIKSNNVKKKVKVKGKPRSHKRVKGKIGSLKPIGKANSITSLHK